MKKIVVLSAFAFLFIAPSSFAQKDEKNMEMKHEKKMNHMEEELDLSEEQRSKIEAIHTKYKPKMEANKNEMEELRKERKKIQEAKKAEVKAVLTPEQMKKMEALKKEHHLVKKHKRSEQIEYNRKEIKKEEK